MKRFYCNQYLLVGIFCSHKFVNDVGKLDLLVYFSVCEIRLYLEFFSTHNLFPGNSSQTWESVSFVNSSNMDSKHCLFSFDFIDLLWFSTLWLPPVMKMWNRLVSLYVPSSNFPIFATCSNFYQRKVEGYFLLSYFQEKIIPLY